MARDLRRQLDSSLNFAANSVASFDLPRDSCYKHIILQMDINVTTTAAASTTFEGAPWTILKRLDLVADGKDVVKSYDGIALMDLNYVDFRTYPYIDTIGLAGAGDIGMQTFVGIITLEARGMENPQHTWLDARKLSSLELRVTWGAGAADIYSVGAGTATIATLRLTPWGHEILDIDPASKFSVNQEVLTQFAFPTATATGKRYKQNVGNAYRRWLISTRDSNNRASVDRMLGMAVLENGTFYRRKWNAGVLKNVNGLMIGPGGVYNSAAASASVQMPQFPTGTGAGAPATGVMGGFRSGFYDLDIAEDGSENSLLDTRGYSTCELEFDWNGANTTDLIRVVPSIYIPNIR